MTTFGDRLRSARNALGLTQDELADRLDVTKSALSAWENNREKPTFDKLPKIRAKLKISLDELVCAVPANDSAKVRIAETAAPYAGGETLTRDELRMLRRFRALTERQRKALITLLGDEQVE